MHIPSFHPCLIFAPADMAQWDFLGIAPWFIRVWAPKKTVPWNAASHIGVLQLSIQCEWFHILYLDESINRSEMKPSSNVCSRPLGWAKVHRINNGTPRKELRLVWICSFIYQTILKPQLHFFVPCLPTYAAHLIKSKWTLMVTATSFLHQLNVKAS